MNGLSEKKRNSVRGACRAEVLRLTKWPTLWILLASWMVLNFVFLYVFNYLTYKSGGATDSPSTMPQEALLQQMLPGAVPEVFTQGMAMFGGALMLIAGALATGSGYGWGTWKTVFTAGPSRTAAFAGTVVALTVIVVALVLAVCVADLGVSAAIAVAESKQIVLPPVAALAESVAAGALILGMWTMAGVLVGVLTRGPALSVGLGLVWVLVVENLLRGVAVVFSPLSFVTDYLPGTAAGSLAGSLRGVSEGETTPGVLDVLGESTAVVLLCVYLVVFGAVSLWLVRTRDIH
ncbi:ABC transporter permease [Rhodococcus sp. NPDC058521]|uniref:ABC transporter permease n=1 Tax=Rhodococcus sp. NPDC058521 TaxID=3346536 RepID=UPI0036634D0F